MNLFPNPTYNNGFLTGNTAKPIAGVCTRTAFTRPLKQAQVNETITQGTAVKLVNKIQTATTTSVNAGGLNEGLAPNVLTATTATASADVNGFIVDSPNFALVDGDAAPAARAGQIVYVAFIGSGAELYLPCDNSLVGVNPDQAVKIENGILKADTGAGISGITLMSQVVDGIRFKVNNGTVEQESTPVIKVKL